MKRHEWLFSYETPVLFAAAQRKRKHHEERASFWRKELAESEAKLRTEGVQFRDMAVTGGTRIDTVLDPQLSNRVAECRSKVTHHEAQRDEYARWERTFAKASQPYLDLNADDVAFFGVADGGNSDPA